jgi:hypothetical protein
MMSEFVWVLALYIRWDEDTTLDCLFIEGHWLLDHLICSLVLNCVVSSFHVFYFVTM